MIPIAVVIIACFLCVLVALSHFVRYKDALLIPTAIGFLYVMILYLLAGFAILNFDSVFVRATLARAGFVLLALAFLLTAYSIHKRYP